MKKEAKTIIDKARREGRKVLMENESKDLCLLYGIPATKAYVARTLDEAVEISKKIGFPLVMKILSPDIIHKSDVGGVILNITSVEEVIEAYRKVISNARKYVPNARIIGVTIQKQAPKGLEVIVGCIKDPNFGHVLMFGLGGIFVEVIKDVSFRVAPVNENEAREMINEIKAKPLLYGYRGHEKVDIDTIVDIITKVSEMVEEIKEIEQIDLNPIFVYSHGAKVVDARIILE